MKFIFATDTHATGKGPSSRTDSYPLAVKKKLLELAQAAKQNKVEAVIHGGDLFDKPVVSLQLTGEIADIIRSSGVPWYVVPGNHDLFGYNINSLPQTSLGLLEKAGVITILDRKCGEITFTENGKTISFEGQEYHKDIDHRAPAFDYYVTSSADYKVLVPHSMLLDKEYFPDVPYTKVEDAAAATEADLILVGHYHDGYRLKTYPNKIGKRTAIFNPGSMLRDEASKGNLSRVVQYLILDFDGQSLNIKEVPFQTAELGTKIFDRSHITAKAQKDKYLSSFEKKLSDVQLDAVDVRTVLDKIIKADPTIDQEINTEAHTRLTGAEQVVTDVGQSLSGYSEKQDNISITKIKIKGFQSHDDTTIRLTDGLNAIIGPSDSGKSAVIRALRFVLYNEPKGSDFIRQSSSSVECSVHFSDGSSIARKRTKTSAGSYLVTDSNGNTTELKGFTNNVPVDIVNTHQMPKIQLTKDKEASLNMGFQLEGPFLIGESPGVRAQIIGQLTGVELVDHALKELNKDVLSNTRDIKSKNESIENIDKKLEGFKDLDKLKNQIDKADKILQHVELIKERLDDLQDLESELLTNQLNKRQVEKQLYVTPDTSNILKEQAKCSVIYQEFESLCELYDDILNHDIATQQARRELEKLPDSSISIDVQHYQSELDKLSELTILKRDLEVVDNSMELITKQLGKLSSISSDKIETLARSFVELEEMQFLSKCFITGYYDMNELETQIDDMKFEEDKYNQEYQELLQEAGTCPTCGQEIGGHTHG